MGDDLVSSMTESPHRLRYQNRLYLSEVYITLFFAWQVHPGLVLDALHMSHKKLVTMNDIEIRNVEVEPIRVRVLPDGRVSRSDAARYLGLKPKTLAMWALSGQGPPSVKVGGRVFYFRTDLDAFIHSKKAPS